MFDKVNILFEAIRPFKVAHDLGCRCSNVENVPSLIDPFTNDTIYITGSGFVSQSKNAVFQAGNIVDLVVYLKKASYLEAVEYLLTIYGTQMDNKRLTALLPFTRTMSSFLRDNRQLFQQYQALRRNVLSGEQPYGRVQQMLQHFDLRPVQAHHLVAAATKQEVEAIWETAERLGGGNVRFSSSGYMVVPYWLNPYTIGAFSFVPVDCPDYSNPPLYPIRPVIPCRNYYFGISTASPIDPVIYVSPEPKVLLQQYSRVIDHAPDSRASMVAIISHPAPQKLKDSTPEIEPLSRGILVCNSGDLAKVLDTNRFFQDLRLVWPNTQFATSFSSAKGFRSYLQENFDHILKLYGENSQEMVTLLQRCQRDATALEIIRCAAEQAGVSEVLNRATVLYREISPDVFAFGKYEVRASADGYQMLRGQAHEEGTYFTNYTIRLHSLLTFKEHTNLKYYRGDLHVGGCSYPIEISRSQLHQGDVITAVAEQAVHSNTEHDDRPELPQLLDRTYKTLLGQLIQHMAKECKVEYGTSRLGWSETRDCYYGAGWEITERGFKPVLRPALPEGRTFKHFDFSTVLEDDPRIKFVPSMRMPLTAIRHINCAAGMVLCGFLGMEAPVVHVPHQPEDQRLLLSSLSLFRQLEAVDLSPNIREKASRIDRVHGYPVVCYSANSQVYSKLRQPAFVLDSDQETAVDSRTVGKDFNEVRLNSVRLLRGLIGRLVLSKYRDIQLQRLPANEQELSELGSWALNAVFPTWRTLGDNSPAVGLESSLGGRSSNRPTAVS